MKKLFAENRLVFMGDKLPPAGGAEKLKSAAEMPGQKEISYEFAKSLIKIKETKTSTGSDYDSNPNNLVKYINKSARAKAKIAAAWVKRYAKKEGYKLSKANVIKKAKEIYSFFTPRSRQQGKTLRAAIMSFQNRAVEERKTSKKEMVKMKDAVGKFQNTLSKKMVVVIKSHVIEGINAGRGENSSSNESTMIKKYIPIFKKIIKGTELFIVTSGNKIEVKTNDIEEAAKRIKQKSRRDQIVASILKHKKPERLASR